MRPIDVAIIGSGFSGLGMAIALQREGKRRYVVLEKGAGVGGTWRENHYPGCACDVPSHLYSFSFAQNPGWSRHFAPQREILAYLERSADEHGVRPHCRFGVEVSSVRLRRGDGAPGRCAPKPGESVPRAARWCSASAALHHPKFPDVPGRESLRGRCSCTRRRGTTGVRSRASGWRWWARGPRPSRWCRRSRRG